jgi:hypothetical protein
MRSFRFKLIYVVFLLFLFGWAESKAQSGLTFNEFKSKLEKYFNSEMLDDIEKQIPQKSRISVWGWDVGDFSGDNYPDLAFSIKILDEKRRNVYVYLFVDLDGYLQLVYFDSYEYLELPLEIGVSIHNNKCSITQKKKNDFWTYKSYTFDNGIIYLAEEYTSQSIFGNALETRIDYEKCEYKINLDYFDARKDKFQTDFLFIPSYPRSKQVFKGYPVVSTAGKVDYVIKGSYYWKGEEDASMRIKSSFDDQYLYFAINFTDDNFIPPECDKCVGDFFSFWFDFTPYKSTLQRIFKQAGNKFIPRSNFEGSLYEIKVFPGDFLDKLPYVASVNSSEPLDEEQIKSISKIKIFVTKEDSTNFVLKVRFPFSLFGYERCPIENEAPVYIGFNIVYHDIDNEFRPEQETLITNSIFDESRPSTFGELVLIPDFRKFSYSKNIFLENIINLLEGFGF